MSLNGARIIRVMRQMLGIALLAGVGVLAGTASAAPLRGDGCESVSLVCVGTLPTSHARVLLRSRNGSSEQGVAFVKLGIHDTEVVIRLKGAPAGVRQPAHIRLGGCNGKLFAPLGNVVGGRRTATVEPLAHTTGFAIVVRASTEKGAPVVACGVVPRHHPR